MTDKEILLALSDVEVCNAYPNIYLDNNCLQWNMAGMNSHCQGFQVCIQDGNAVVQMISQEVLAVRGTNTWVPLGSFKFEDVESAKRTLSNIIRRWSGSSFTINPYHAKPYPIGSFRDWLSQRSEE